MQALKDITNNTQTNISIPLFTMSGINIYTDYCGLFEPYYYQTYERENENILLSPYTTGNKQYTFNALIEPHDNILQYTSYYIHTVFI